MCVGALMVFLIYCQLFYPHSFAQSSLIVAVVCYDSNDSGEAPSQTSPPSLTWPPWGRSRAALGVLSRYPKRHPEGLCWRLLGVFAQSIVLQSFADLGPRSQDKMLIPVLKPLRCSQDMLTIFDAFHRVALPVACKDRFRDGSGRVLSCFSNSFWILLRTNCRLRSFIQSCLTNFINAF